MPAFCMDDFMYLLSTKYPDIRSASTAMNTFPSTFSNVIVLNWMLDFCYSLSEPSDFFQHADIVPFL